MSLSGAGHEAEVENELEAKRRVAQTSPRILLHRVTLLNLNGNAS